MVDEIMSLLWKFPVLIFADDSSYSLVCHWFFIYLSFTSQTETVAFYVLDRAHACVSVREAPAILKRFS